MSKAHENDSLGSRMKSYETVNKDLIMRRTPTIIRIDGKAFHTFTKKAKFDFPFSVQFHEMMRDTAIDLVSEIQCAQIAYFQSDEISILLNDWKNIYTEQWFRGNIQKMTSVSASIATASFNSKFIKSRNPDFLETFRSFAMFDSRVFQLPEHEVNNYFIWRQQDASRNSVQMLGRSHFSHKELDRKSNDKVQEMLFEEHGVNWNDLESWKRRGSCVTRYGHDDDIPLFTQDRNYIPRYLGANE